ncbi:phosphatidylserine/phosphatidylglycerophosphate/cardiolipin synthase family protein [Bdellovibrionota bacterium FG-2]
MRSRFAFFCAVLALATTAISGALAGDQQWYHDKALTGNKMQLLVTGAETQRARLALIRTARNSLYLSAYIFKNDEYAKLYIDQLCKRARQGLDVRLLLDNHGGRKSSDYLPQLESCGVRVLYFNPPNWDLGNMMYTIHEKLMIADGQWLVIGGSGFANEYKSFGKDDDTWYDLDLLVKGPAACWFQRQFNKTWARSARTGNMGFDGAPNSPQYMEHFYGLYSAKDCTIYSEGESTALPIYSNPLFDQDNRESREPEHNLRTYIKAIKDAKHNIRLYAPYFVPHSDFNQAIIEARSRGVEVSVITNSYDSIDPEGRPVILGTFATTKPLMNAGVKILAWPKYSVLHRKAGVFDNTLAYVGTDNLDRRGVEYQSESTLFTDTPEIVNTLTAQFDEDAAISIPFEPKYIAEIQSKNTKWNKFILPFILDYL